MVGVQELGPERQKCSLAIAGHLFKAHQVDCDCSHPEAPPVFEPLIVIHRYLDVTLYAAASNEKGC